MNIIKTTCAAVLILAAGLPGRAGSREAFGQSHG